MTTGEKKAAGSSKARFEVLGPYRELDSWHVVANEDGGPRILGKFRDKQLAVIFLGQMFGSIQTSAGARTIDEAKNVLGRSARGMAVGRDLHRILDGAVAGLDVDGKMAVLELLAASFFDSPGSVLDALSVFVPGGAA